MQKDTVVDKRRHPFFTIDNDVILEYGPKIGSNALALYVILACHAKESSGSCYPSIKRLMSQMKRSRDTVFDAIAVLKEYGLISVEERKLPESQAQTTNLYTLLALPHPGPDSGYPSPNNRLGSPNTVCPPVQIADAPQSEYRIPPVCYSDTEQDESEQDESNQTNLKGDTTPPRDDREAEQPASLIRAAALALGLGTRLSGRLWEIWRPIAERLLEAAAQPEILQCLALKLAEKRARHTPYKFEYLEADLPYLLVQIRGSPLTAGMTPLQALAAQMEAELDAIDPDNAHNAVYGRPS